MLVRVYVPAVLNVLNCVASMVHGRKKFMLYRLAMAMGPDSQRLHKQAFTYENNYEHDPDQVMGVSMIRTSRWRAQKKC